MNYINNSDLGFIDKIISEQKLNGLTTINTCFQPEPYSCLHIGSLKTIWIEYSIAQKHHGHFFLRFEDTEPYIGQENNVKEIINDLIWLGMEPDRVTFSSDYFDQCFKFGIKLIESGVAYVDDLTKEQVKNRKGDYYKSGENSPFRDRSIDENLFLFTNMRNGLFESGTKTLRLKIDMTSANMYMRDPIIYRTVKEKHQRTKDKWCIYPTYLFSNPVVNAIEGITHSFSTLEYSGLNPLYDWIIQHIDAKMETKQYEISKLSIKYNLTNRLKIKELVDNKMVDGFDDPRLLTISGLRRRGYTPQSLINFLQSAGVSKNDVEFEYKQLQRYVIKEYNASAKRRIAIKNPLEVVITNLSDDYYELMEFENNPADASQGTRKLPFTNRLFIERDDFAEIPEGDFRGLCLNGKVKLINSYIISCHSINKRKDGSVEKIYCSYEPADSYDKKQLGSIHWLSKENARSINMIFYDDCLLTCESARRLLGNEIVCFYNEKSLIKYSSSVMEKSLIDSIPREVIQFVRIGFFICDNEKYICVAPLNGNRKV